MSADLNFDVVELVPVTSPATAPLREIGFRADVWLPAEDALLRQLFAADMCLSDIAERVGRSFQATRNRVCVLGLRRNSTRPWLPEEDAEMTARYGTEAAASIALSLGRSVSAVYVRAALLKLSDPGAAPYDEWEDAQIRAGYERAVPVRQIATLIGRTVIGVCCRASLIGVRHPHQPPNWAEAEMMRALELAEEGHRYISIIEMLVAEGWPRRSKSAFNQRVRILGYGRGWGRPWSPDEDELLRRAYAESTSLIVLAARLGRTKHSLKWRAEYLELQGKHGKKAGWRGETWTDADLALLRAEFGKTPSKELAKKLGRSPSAMITRAHVLGLHHGYIRMFTPGERRAIGIAWRLGLPLGIVAKAVDRDPAVISKQAIRLGIPFDSPNRPVLPTRAVRKNWPDYSLEQILALLPPDAEFDGKLEAASAAIDEKARANRSAGASRKGREYRERMGIAA